MSWNKPMGKYPKEWNKIKQMIAMSANFKCSLCKEEMDGKDHIWGRSSKWYRVHHINLNKSDCRLENLIYLCSKCHGKIHTEINKEIKTNGN